MKTPWWLHLLVGVVLISTGILAWHSWMISTRESPVVILHKHIYVPEPAWLDDKEHQAMWDELHWQQTMVGKCAVGGLLLSHAVKEFREDATNALANEDARIQVDLAQLRVDLKASNLEIKKLKQAIYKSRCGGW